MAIREDIEKALAENKRIITDDPQKLSEFIEDLKKEGLLEKKQYDLSPLDIVGRQLYQKNRLKYT